MPELWDAHAHAWRLWPYDASVPDPEARGSADALLRELDAHGVERAVVVCARIGGGRDGAGFANADNNDYVAQAVRRHPDRLIAWVDVDSMWSDEHHAPGAARRLREALERAEARGFTHYVRETNDGWLRGDDAGELFRTAAQLGVIASLSIGAEWFDDLEAVARANPTLPILIHHLSLPRPERRDADLAALTALAVRGNIGVKVSGLQHMSARGWDFPYRDVQPVLRRVLEAFGAERLYWGSDFPASRDLLTYRQAIEVVREHAGLTAGDRAGILGGNLRRLLLDPVIPSA